jgi:hypothetical protein
MFRVPTDAQNPTFDNTTKIGFFKWLTSSKTDRIEWARRRNAAAQTARTNTNTKVDAWAEQKKAEQAAKREAKKAR